MLKKLLTIGLLILTLLLNGIIMNRAANATDYDSTSPLLAVEVNSYAVIDNDCSGSSMVLTVGNDGTTFMKAAVGKRYGYDICTINFGYNDPTQKYAITMGKTENQLMSSYIPALLTGDPFLDIDNAGTYGPVDDSIISSGNVDEEELGFRINSATLAAGSVQTDPELSKQYTESTCGGGSSSCYFDIEFKDTPDTLISSLSGASCPYGSCYFDLKIAANLSAYSTYNDYTISGYYSFFYNPLPATFNPYQINIVLTTSTP